MKPKSGARKHAIGYQPELLVILQWCDGATPPIVTCVCVNSSYGMWVDHILSNVSQCVREFVDRFLIVVMIIARNYRLSRNENSANLLGL